MKVMSVPVNADAERQARSEAVWNAVAPGWAGYADRIDELAAVITDRLLDLADVRDGDRIITSTLLRTNQSSLVPARFAIGVTL